MVQCRSQPTDYNEDSPETVTQNAFSWPGMQIDQLQQRILSVYIGRNIITLVGIDRGITSGCILQVRAKFFSLSYSLNRR